MELLLCDDERKLRSIRGKYKSWPYFKEQLKEIDPKIHQFRAKIFFYQCHQDAMQNKSLLTGIDENSSNTAIHAQYAAVLEELRAACEMSQDALDYYLNRDIASKLTDAAE